MEFLFPISIPKPLAPINDQNFKKGRLAFLFTLVFEIRFSDALLAAEVIFKFLFELCKLLRLLARRDTGLKMES